MHNVLEQKKWSEYVSWNLKKKFCYPKKNASPWASVYLEWGGIFFSLFQKKTLAAPWDEGYLKWGMKISELRRAQLDRKIKQEQTDFCLLLILYDGKYIFVWSV